MNTTRGKARILGAGLAGSEAAWQLAQRNIEVTLYEMRPHQTTKAHKTSLCAELVCSNSFRGAGLENAVGLLKEELALWNSLIMEAAKACEVPAGGALAVDRERFSRYVDDKIHSHPLITVVREEIVEIPETSAQDPVIVATGPLTSQPLARAIEQFTGHGNLAFYDAISPIIFRESINAEKVFRQSRYDKGGDDYLNIPLEREAYYTFVEQVLAAEKYTGNIAVEQEQLGDLRPFEGCMPIEDMAERGPDTLLFGPLKPVGLTDPRTGKRPYAVIQLRQDDLEGELWSMVGLQTRMKRADQQRIFTSLPGLELAEFVRYGSVHRNTFIDSPQCLDATLAFRGRPGLFFAGQITGVEGYVESTAGGLAAALNVYRLLSNAPLIEFPRETALGALLGYISETGRKDFQPMNISFGLMPSYLELPNRNGRQKIPKKERRLSASNRALAATAALIRTVV
ncbi:MAG: methylenetetrahydrofolate--tRNA-(uracil(54)-C(5))-methyltransferase (FADH(2)-oxidizing) TrmFO [Bdellovibrionales bacterium]|nr:methylenetetrahydrofolate--tRNA-(uracil(54)-C(5))-methyltransferase (FADH(2)-oxidizing) TrmFO [Bdellovibrionales bacterium]